MNILFLHRNFPAQFKYLASILAANPKNSVFFVTNNADASTIKNVNKITYKLKRQVPPNCHKYLRFYEESIIHGQSAAEVLLAMKNKGYKPDVIYGHTWGPTLFVKDIFPDVPLICHFEWYYNADGADVGFNSEEVTINMRAKLKCKNSHILLDLINCDYGISPTEWQKKQFPKEFHHKIKVIHEGIDTNICIPNEHVQFVIQDKNITLDRNNEILTYATRGMEEYRGFPQFMQAVEKLQKLRPNMHTIIAGEDKIFYGKHLKNDTFKNKMLRELDPDLKRIHFTGPLRYNEYIKLLQVSSAHVYLTYPFVLSWSLPEAMACGCPIIASDTAPVKEVIKDEYNGLLTNFFDVDTLIMKINYVLDNKNNINTMRKNARTTILDKYDLVKLLPKQIEILNAAKSKIPHL